MLITTLRLRLIVIVYYKIDYIVFTKESRDSYEN